MGSGASGAWANQTGRLACWHGCGWFFCHAARRLVGDDNFIIKVSADGGLWVDALRIAGTGGVTLSQVLTLTPRAVPASPLAGQVYFASGDAMLRCYDGTLWHDLFKFSVGGCLVWGSLGRCPKPRDI
jgi:hypothetical protein